MICDICNYQLGDKPRVIIKNVPNHTFNCYVEPVDLHLIECPHCGVVMLEYPPPSDDWATVYRSLSVSPSAILKKKEQLRWFIDKWNLHGKKICELGCGDGQILDLLTEIGETNIEGIEAGLDNAIACTKKGYTVYSTHYPDHPSADAIICSYHLEHYQHPTWIMHRIYDMLNPGGVAYIEVPDYDWIEAHGIWKELTRDHRHYFTSRALDGLISKCGLYREGQNYSDPLCLAVVARKRKSEHPLQLTYRVGLASLAQRMEEDVNKFLALVQDLGTYAVYGAGHYSQSMLHQVYQHKGNMPNVIFDGNPQKVGGHICFIPVKPPDHEEIREYSHVVVICGAYNDEVMEILSGITSTVIRWD